MVRGGTSDRRAMACGRAAGDRIQVAEDGSFKVLGADRRTPLFAADPVIAAWLALTATGLLTTFTFLSDVAWHRGSAAGLAMLIALLFVAVVNLLRPVHTAPHWSRAVNFRTRRRRAEAFHGAARRRGGRGR
jgi:hypothetical protein